MTIKNMPLVVAIAVVVALLGGAIGSAQEKYSLRVHDGLAFSDFKGYETWQMVSLSHSDDTLNVILANAVMIKAYQAGIPGNGKPWPDGAKAAKIQYIPKKSVDAPFNVAVPDVLKDVAFMAKDAEKFADSGGWAYALFDYDRASGKFTPNGTGVACGAACHTAAKSKDYVFTEYGTR